VGTATIQVAKSSGARVIAVVSSDAKEDMARRGQELTDGRGVDVLMDPVGGDRFPDSLRSLAPEGRLLVVGVTEGAEDLERLVAATGSEDVMRPESAIVALLSRRAADRTTERRIQYPTGKVDGSSFTSGQVVA